MSGHSRRLDGARFDGVKLPVRTFRDQLRLDSPRVGERGYRKERQEDKQPLEH